ncbi:MAG TPA: adenylate/guanylate cyclase domain-containing protein, partial [Chthonomonadaceae bacterium]|nr:adenylate/guanylate cyclase domain-containing protein [Chthonomonadaceae bacterium]
IKQFQETRTFMPLGRLTIPHAWRSTAISVGIGLFASLAVLVAPRLGGLQRRGDAGKVSAVQTLYDKLDTTVYDYLFQVRGPHSDRLAADGKPIPSISDVVIVGEDEHSAETVNALYARLGSHGPPYPRRVMADLVTKLSDAGARVIGIDVLFSTDSADPDDDRAFAAALKRSGNVVLVAGFSASPLQNAEAVSQREDFPIPSLRHAAFAVAPGNVPKDKLDGDVRRFRLTLDGPDDPDLPLQSKAYPTFATLIAAMYLNDTGHGAGPGATGAFEENLVRGLEQGAFVNGPVHFHLADSQTGPDDNRSVNICFAGYPGRTTCAVHSLGETLLPRNAARLRDWFAGKIVLVGSTTLLDQDRYVTPLRRQLALSGIDPTEASSRLLSESADRYGVEIHANIIHTLVARHFYREFDPTRRVVLIWMCGLITALLVARLRPVLALLPIAALLAGICLLVATSFQRYVVLRPVQIGLATVLAYGLESVYFYGVEDRRARRARATFQRYVGPNVMTRVLDTDFKPGTVEERHLTIMFTDVQGFTSLSEKMRPHEVVATFNRYLNEMVEIIDRYGGTLDKIMGDGIMAYFNAPLPLPNHEQKAVECALEMQSAMRSWRELSENLGLPPLKVRIGINSGDVVFGEVGAKRQLGYTVIGDAVNAAARLEPLNKEFGTEILISEAVLEKLDGTIDARYVGELTIRGREEGIRAYSVTGRAATTPES